MGTLLFPVLILILFVLVLWVIIGCKGWWFAKFWLINLSLIFVLIFWSSVSSYLGWPTDNPLPDTFRFLAFYPEEPKSLFVLVDKHGDEKPRSITESFNYQASDTIRLHKLPYSKEMHERLEAAQERALKGAYVIGSKNNILDAEQLRKLQRQQNSDGSEGNSLNRFLAEHNFYILPPSLFMKKPDR
jgi:predicted RNA-binding protein YlxR (DUF448 family)